MATLSYPAALEALKTVSHDVPANPGLKESHERVRLAESPGRISAVDIHGPVSTPQWDTSAMDGYAIRSDATRCASPEAPVLFRICGTIAAGDDPAVALVACPKRVSALEDELGESCCVEIMTGARFPDSGDGKFLDACVRVEDVTHILPRHRCDGVRIAVTKRIARNANRRFAGDDIRKGEVILKAGQLIQPSHVMAIASVGIQSVVVVRRPRLGIWSTGKELGDGSSTGSDVNGPFLQAASCAFGAMPSFLGVLDDDLQDMVPSIRKQSESGNFDVLVTSGGVSMGKFDIVRKAVDYLGGRVIFHGLEIRPGHPVLFALISSSNGGDTPFFGLPGNPGAAAACFRFLVVPYIRHLLGQAEETPLQATLDGPCIGKELHRGLQLDRFSPGRLLVNDRGENVVSDVGGTKGPAKLSPFISADCWIHFRRGQRVEAGQVVCCYPGNPWRSGE